jgi:SPP1 gp7 family putative phage head morphogenesis protein
MDKSLRDVYLRHGINLTRYSNYEAQRLIKILDASNSQIQCIIRKAKAIETKEKYYRVAAEIRRVTKECHEQLDGQVEIDFMGLAAEETRFVEKVLSGANVKADFELPAPKKIWAAAGFGSYSEQGHETFETYLNTLSDNLYKTWDMQVRTGYLTGMTAKQINRAVLGSTDGIDPGQMQVLRRSLESNTKTMVAHLAETARDAVYRENSSLFSGYRYLGTLDTRTCMVCGELDGKIFKEIEDAPALPQHLACRCLLVPVVKGMEDHDEDDTRASMDGPVSANISYSDWLKTQPDEIVRDILGPARFEMFKRGAEVSQFVADGRTLTLSQLRKLEGVPELPDNKEIFKTPTDNADLNKLAESAMEKMTKENRLLLDAVSIDKDIIKVLDEKSDEPNAWLNGKIQLRPSVADNVKEGGENAVLHEIGHMLDEKLTSLMGKYHLSEGLKGKWENLGDALKKDWFELIKKHGGVDQVREFVLNASAGKAHEYDAITDMIGGLSGRFIPERIGHKDEYWADVFSSPKGKECFAHLFVASNDETKYNFFNEYFPNAVKWYSKVQGILLGKIDKEVGENRFIHNEGLNNREVSKFPGLKNLELRKGWSPEFREKLETIMDHNSDGKLDIELYEQLKKEYPDIDERLKKIKQFKDENKIIVSFSLEDRIDNFIKEPLYKTQFETGTSGGTLDTTKRNEWESIIAGKNTDGWIENKERPVYGCVADISKSAVPTARYGGSYFVLKDDVRIRTTYTIGNSSHKQGSFIDDPIAMLNANKNIPDRGTGVSTVAYFSDEIIGRSLKQHSYLESQIWGGVDILKDVEMIVIPKNNQFGIGDNRDYQYLTGTLDTFRQNGKFVDKKTKPLKKEANNANIKKWEEFLTMLENAGVKVVYK